MPVYAYDKESGYLTGMVLPQSHQQIQQWRDMGMGITDDPGSYDINLHMVENGKIVRRPGVTDDDIEKAKEAKRTILLPHNSEEYEVVICGIIYYRLDNIPQIINRKYNFKYKRLNIELETSLFKFDFFQTIPPHKRITQEEMAPGRFPKSIRGVDSVEFQLLEVSIVTNLSYTLLAKIANRYVCALSNKSCEGSDAFSNHMMVYAMRRLYLEVLNYFIKQCRVSFNLPALAVDAKDVVHTPILI